jgi:hypothetical protein
MMECLPILDWFYYIMYKRQFVYEIVYVKVQSFLHFPIPRNFPNFPGLVKEMEEQKCMCDLSYSKNHATYST